AAEFKGTRFATNPDTPRAAVCSGCEGHDLVGGSVTLGVRYLVSAPLAVSAQDGFSWSALYRRRAEVSGARWSSEARTRLGVYLHVPGIGGFARHVLALRLAAGGPRGARGGLVQAGGGSAGGVGVAFRQDGRGARAFSVGGVPGGRRV